MVNSSKKITETLFQFRGMSRDVWQADWIIKRLSSKTCDSESTHRSDLSHNLLKKRINFAADAADIFFNQTKKEKPNYSPLGNGGESIVMDCDNGYVLKIRTGTEYAPPKAKTVLQPELIKYSKDTHTSIGIFKKAELCNPTYFQRQKIFYSALAEGVFIRDTNPSNFGYIQNSNSGKSLVLIDSDAAKKIDDIKDIYRVTKKILQPLYTSMPLIHPAWRQFKTGLQTVLGVKSTNIPSPAWETRKIL